MNKAVTISVFSSFANDRVLDETGRVLFNQRKGPAFFIEKALKDAGVQYDLQTRDVINVDILLTKDGEFGRVNNTPEPSSLPVIPIDNWVIISTVLSEWQIGNTILPEKTFIDLQGYVRDGNDFGKKKQWIDMSSQSRNFYCVKGTEEEISCLPEDILRDQKKRLLIETRAEKGLNLYYQNKQFTVEPLEIVRGIQDSIGAGDTFLGYFVAFLFKNVTFNPESAAIEASRKTTEFLKDKMSVNKQESSS